ncbi:MAG TPA: serine/threonine-protein kinase [Polyangia bacterium]|nr:serine/threonine-protein kinase [Polyangia bacterium]
MGSPEEMVGRRVGRYTILSHLASGGMAELYIARQESVGGFEKSVVVKLLQGRYAANPRVVSMFLDEARLAAKLNHPSIVHVYDVAEDDGMKYIAMEYIQGETVTDIVLRGIEAQNFLPLQHAVHIISQTAAGLAYAHGHRDTDGKLLRIVHRDVSPSNVLVSYEGQTKIVDFGIARIQDQIREESGMRPGKPSYMSPEQVRGEGADIRSDIFSLGIILYEITVGQRLFRGTADEVMQRILEETIAPPTVVKHDYPAALELIVMKALERRPEDRYQSAEDMRHDLEEFVHESGFRTGNRRMALYLREIFPAAAAAARDGTVRPADADALSGPNVGTGLGQDEGQELNFDRRAPLAMRLEPAPPAGATARTPAPAVKTALPLPVAGGAGAVPARAVAAATIPGNERSEAHGDDSVSMEVPRRRGWLLVAALLLFGVVAMVFTVLK